MVKISSSVHMRLEDGLTLRKEILETALRASELMRRFKEYKKENKEKTILISRFKKEISNISSSLHDLEFKELPREITKKLTLPEQEIKQEIADKTVEEIEQEFKEPIVKSELQSELDSLRAKIENIKI